MPESSGVEFRSARALEEWLSAHHGSAREVWVRIFKKDSGTPSVTWEDCVESCLKWGWIDAQRKALDAVSFLQRLTPRRPGSEWSMRNRRIAEDLEARGELAPAGQAQVVAARNDGRWERAYAGSADMVFPAQFLAALQATAAARQAFEALDRPSMYRIYLQLQSSRSPEQLEQRVAAAVLKLARSTSD